MQESLQKLQNLLQQLFRADAADLDFGIYRIINYRRDQLQAFIDGELPTIVKDALDTNTEIEFERKEFESLRDQIPDGMLDADDNLINETFAQVPIVKKFLEAKEKRGEPQTPDQREDVVYNHLYNFFSRYYDNGDFIPRRRYSQTERYAVPYNGEEVYLHWTNRDQYYVKSGDHFSNYRFKSQGISVIFDLRDVDIEKDNVQGAKRFFIPLSTETKYNIVSKSSKSQNLSKIKKQAVYVYQPRHLRGTILFLWMKVTKGRAAINRFGENTEKISPELDLHLNIVQLLDRPSPLPTTRTSLRNTERLSHSTTPIAIFTEMDMEKTSASSTSNTTKKPRLRQSF